jgi:hypothetical protein
MQVRDRKEYVYKIHRNSFESLDLKLDIVVSKRTCSGKLLKILEPLTSTLRSANSNLVLGTSNFILLFLV